MASCHWNIFLNCCPFLHIYFTIKDQESQSKPELHGNYNHTNSFGGITGKRSCSHITALSAGCLMGRSLKVQGFFLFLLLSTLVERRCCKIQATLLQNKKRCQSQSCQELYFSSAWVRVGPVKQQFSLQWYSLVFSVVSWAFVQA